jgi:hypothetical protein
MIHKPWGAFNSYVRSSLKTFRKPLSDLSEPHLHIPAVCARSDVVQAPSNARMREGVGGREKKRKETQVKKKGTN